MPLRRAQPLSSRLGRNRFKLNRLRLWVFGEAWSFSENRLPPRIKSGASFFPDHAPGTVT